MMHYILYKTHDFLLFLIFCNMWGIAVKFGYCKICSYNLAIIARVVLFWLLLIQQFRFWALQQIWSLLSCYKIFIMSHGILTHHHPLFTPIKKWFGAFHKGRQLNSHLFLFGVSCALFSLYIFILLSWVILLF